MKDMQSEPDDRGLDIHKVGIKGFQLPIYVKVKDSDSKQPCIGTFNVYSSLPPTLKGVHMSHFASVLQDYCTEVILSLDLLERVKNQIKQSQSIEMKGKPDGEIKAHLEMEFVYFIKKIAPRSRVESNLPIKCKFIVSDYHHPILEVRVPITTLCPCSKEISYGGGAHNQRSWITVAVQMLAWVWIEDLVNYAEKSASCPIYPVLRRQDEKIVTEVAYDNPKFVEDVIRDLELFIGEDDCITWYRLYVENEESIHVHNAYAEKEGGIYTGYYEPDGFICMQTEETCSGDCGVECGGFKCSSCIHECKQPHDQPVCKWDILIEGRAYD